MTLFGKILSCLFGCQWGRLGAQTYRAELLSPLRREGFQVSRNEGLLGSQKAMYRYEPPVHMNVP